MVSLKEALEQYQWRDSYYDLYPGYSRKLDEDKECMFDTEQGAKEDAQDLINMFKHLPNPIPVYRVVGVKNIEELDQEDPGDSWSFIEKSALGFAGHNHIPKPWVLLRGYAPKNDVSWYETFRLFHHFSGGADSESENEIRVDGRKIKNLKAKLIS